MRIELVRQAGHPVPQFVVYAENQVESMILEAFFAYGQGSKRPIKFHLHGWTRTDGRITSFNFGYVFDSEAPTEPVAPATHTDYRVLTGHALDAYLAEHRPDLAPRCPEEADSDLRARLSGKLLP